MPEAKLLVLITGAPIFLGFLTLLNLLKLNCRVRVAVRSEAKAEGIQKFPVLQSLSPSSDDLTFVIVSDFAAPGAFNFAPKDATFAVHLVAPGPSSTGQVTEPPYQSELCFVRSLVNSHIGLLQSTAAAAIVRRMVFTNTVMTVTPFALFIGFPDVPRSILTRSSPKTPASRIQRFFSLEFDSYAGGKVAALIATEKWIAENRETAGFNITNILTAALFGRNNAVQSVKEFKADGTNTLLPSFLLWAKGDGALRGSNLR